MSSVPGACWLPRTLAGRGCACAPCRGLTNSLFLFFPICLGNLAQCEGDVSIPVRPVCCAASARPSCRGLMPAQGPPSGFCNWLASVQNLWFVGMRALAREAAPCKC